MTVYYSGDFGMQSATIFLVLALFMLKVRNIAQNGNNIPNPIKNLFHF